MISVDEALAHVFALVTRVDSEEVPLRNAAGRVLAADVVALRNQPPFRASVMDGYAVAGDGPWRVVGQAAAGHAFAGSVADGDAVRIFTGGVVPEGADRVVIQEDVVVTGERISLGAGPDSERYIREIGADFKVGDRLAAPRRLTPADVALAASMNVPRVTVARRPRLAIIATGDELVMPGEDPRPDQIIASNSFGLAAMAEAEGAEVRLLPVARDTRASLTTVFGLARDADLVVTIGGASVGDHDLVGEVAADLGMERAFYKIAMRPGKPLMAGRMGQAAMVGLPGNPVSAMVCGHLFLRPMLRAMQGLPAERLREGEAILSAPLGPNGPRQHYMRACRDDDGIRAAERQDSSLLTVLAGANVLIVRPPHDPARHVGEQVRYINL
ncbi:molybdopterin molybdenumtransferase MoeA [Silicimonas algicola]|uniref:Molybdopterin molybdenumtransferase n=1 Tax=Silicimonas algicola TaxID=1826607 RepID=A0A316G8K4_9RHOB|nr:molybdopterin molybdotransferase MoeA [Silicimonas algicola]AZQ67265.1 molybdopterin molybdenumtransferase MoeA [Silicimonas algicola]PWK56932.1 molybdopterin molybdotransferase [Silicimonas algicola]